MPSSGYSPRRRGRRPLDHQRRQHFQVGIQRLPVQQAGQLARQAVFALLIGEAGIGRAELQIGHQPVKHPPPLSTTTNAPSCTCMGRHGQAHVQVFLQAAADDIADRIGEFVHNHLPLVFHFFCKMWGKAHIYRKFYLLE